MAEEKTPARKNDGGSPIASELRSMPMEHLIGAPLAASVKAQKQLVHEMINYVNMLAYGSEDAEAGAEVKTLDMTLERPVTSEDGTISKQSVQVAPPILDLIPDLPF